MEALERTAFVWPATNDEIIVSSVEHLSSQNIEVWRPERFTERSSTKTHELAWISGQTLSGQKVWLPADLVFVGKRPDYLPPPAFDVSTSNGLASGFSLNETLRRACFEVIERHVVSLLELQEVQLPYFRLHKMWTALGLNVVRLEEEFVEGCSTAISIRVATLPQHILEACPFLLKPSSHVSIKSLNNQFGLNIIAAALVEELSPGNVLAAAGFGISPSKFRALEKALFEMAQSRATDRQGAREDCGYSDKQRWTTIPKSHWLLDRTENSLDFSKLSNFPDQRPLTDHLKQGGFKDAAYVVRSMFDGIVCARVLVPGVETWHATAGQSRSGLSVRRTRGRN